jgi:hypothetical protein
VKRQVKHQLPGSLTRSLLRMATARYRCIIWSPLRFLPAHNRADYRDPAGSDLPRLLSEKGLDSHSIQYHVENSWRLPTKCWWWGIYRGILYLPAFSDV